jgi:hypothetical protein
MVLHYAACQEADVRSQAEHLWVCLTISIAVLKWDTVRDIEPYTSVSPSGEIIDTSNIGWFIDIVGT